MSPPLPSEAVVSQAYSARFRWLRHCYVAYGANDEEVARMVCYRFPDFLRNDGKHMISQRKNEHYWNAEATRIAKAILALQGIKRRELVSHLGKIGVLDSKAAIASKLSRGKFSFAFVLQVMAAVGVENVLIRTPRAPQVTAESNVPPAGADRP